MEARVDRDIEALDSVVSGTFGLAADAMSYDTVDSETQEWQRIAAATAFRMPNGDEVLVMRCIGCPVERCGMPLALVLATGATVSYRRRHEQCVIVDEERMFEGMTLEEAQRNG